MKLVHPSPVAGSDNFSLVSSGGAVVVVVVVHMTWVVDLDLGLGHSLHGRDRYTYSDTSYNCLVSVDCVHTKAVTRTTEIKH